jgi:anaerobic selenocysteine-containing dehydrogenase
VPSCPVSAADERRDKRGTKIITIDPRRTATAETADLHLALAPGADVVLWSGLLVYLANHNHLDKDWISRHVTGFEETLEPARKRADHRLHCRRRQPENRRCSRLL